MPIFKKTLFDDNTNKELYKKYMNEKYDVELLFNFYWKSFITDPKIFENHPLLSKRLRKLSEEYFIVRSKEEISDANINAPIKYILYKNLIPIDLSSDNYLFTKFMKFHLGFLKFNQWYKPNEFNKLEVSDTIMKDYLIKELLLCLDKSKRDLGEKIKTLSDFQIISKTCVKERLSLYNFLVDFEIDNSNAKDFINKMYLKTYRNRVYSLDFSKEVKDISIDSLIKIYSNVKQI